MLVYSHNDCLLKNNGSNHPERSARLEKFDGDFDPEED